MRVQVNLSETMLTKVDAYAELMGVTRSALCSIFVGQGIMGYDKAFDVLNSMVDKLIEQEKGTTQMPEQINLLDIIEVKNHKKKKTE